MNSSHLEPPCSLARVKRLLYLPHPDEMVGHVNSYTDQMIRAFQRLGYQLQPRLGRLPTLGEVMRRRETTAVLNWQENALLNKQGRLTVLKTVKFLLSVLRLRMRASRLIFVRHNVAPHIAVDSSYERVRKILDYSERWLFSRTIVHSRHYLGPSRRHVPHPKYPIQDSSGDEVCEDTVIFFGRIDPYKGLERLIESWDQDATLVIAGKCEDSTYFEKLNAAASGKNIRFIRGVLSDSEAAGVMRRAMSVIVPHSPPSMIVSGSLYFALSAGVPCICIGQSHARLLQSEGVRGVVSVAGLSEVDWGCIRSISRAEIRDDCERYFGLAAVTDALRSALN